MIFIGFDPREADAFAVCRHSIRQFNRHIQIRGLVLDDLRAKGLYWRKHERRADGRVYDVISDAPISTEHANARFLVPHLAKEGWAIFCDSDMLFRANPSSLLVSLDSKRAVYCVKHDYQPKNTQKMDGQAQTVYARKNWSSFVAFNCSHPANRALTVEMVNTLPGRDLHRFCWLQDEEIGELDPSWNFLVGHSDPSIDPKVVHFTEGTPSMPGYENQPFADDWRKALTLWANGTMGFGG